MNYNRGAESAAQILIPSDYYPGLVTGLRLSGVKKKMAALKPHNYPPDYRGISAKVEPGRVVHRQRISSYETHVTTVNLAELHDGVIYLDALQEVYLENEHTYNRTYSSMHGSDNSFTLHNVRTILDSVHELQTSQVA